MKNNFINIFLFIVKIAKCWFYNKELALIKTSNLTLSHTK